MSKVFLLGKKQKAQHAPKHWDEAQSYGPVNIKEIPDPDGGETTTAPPSIPSPFARLDLVKTAFANLTSDDTPTMMDQKLVSDCWDIGEIFFNIDALRDKVQLIPWERAPRLSALASGGERHQLFAETLELYLTQDKATYNFDKLDSLCIVQYNHKTIGGTSPKTLFFAAGGDMSFVDIKLSNNDKLLDSEYCELAKRDEDFQRYIYLLFRAYPHLTSEMREVWEYLQNRWLKQVEREKPGLFAKIKAIDGQAEAEADLNKDFQPLNSAGDGSVVKPLGDVVLRRKQGAQKVTSDFEINSVHAGYGDKKALVLQNRFNEKLRYVGGEWEPLQTVPFTDDKPLDKRTLPGQTVVNHPYLTVDDFLEPYLVRMPYPLYKDKFYDGNVTKGDSNKGYLLPLKPLFFEFFSTQDLMGNPNLGNRPMIEIQEWAGDGRVQVSLRIPIRKQGKYITFEREYFMSRDHEVTQPEISADTNKGVLLENVFAVAVFPFIKTGRPEIKAHYRVGVVEADLMSRDWHNKYDLDFFANGEKKSKEKHSVKRSDKERGDGATSTYFAVDEEFDYIRVGQSRAQGVLLPKFKKYQAGSKKFTFAIDFGTTNTHIEYRMDSNDPQPFEITEENERQLVKTFNSEEAVRNPVFDNFPELRDLFPKEFLPDWIGKRYNYSLPTRTALGQLESINLKTHSFTLGHFGIAFFHEKLYPLSSTRIYTNLKWSRFNSADSSAAEDLLRVKAFFEEILFLLRNKVLLNDGALDKVELRWFYPSSMSEGRRTKMERTWEELAALYFSPDIRPVGMSESIAPYYWYRNKKNVAATENEPAVGIDIGGGTTDVVVFSFDPKKRANVPVCLTSFRFAANAVFGDAYGSSPAMNGFVHRYRGRIRQLLEENKQYELAKILDGAETLTSDANKDASAEIVSFLLSLETNKRLNDNKIKIAFNKMLSDDGDLKVVFLVFYGAICYHLASLMHRKGFAPPRYVLFSGTGSKITNVLDPNMANPKTLTKLTRLIFREVYKAAGSPDAEKAMDIELRMEDQPKEITCKGGLLDTVNPDVEDIKDLLFGDTNRSLKSDLARSYKDLHADKDLIKSVETEIGTFLDLLFGLNKSGQISYRELFDINTGKLDEYKQMLLKDSNRFIIDGISKKQDELGSASDEAVAETLFFYPLVGGLNKLAFEVVKNG